MHHYTEAATWSREEWPALGAQQKANPVMQQVGEGHSCYTA
jgi:hypothetical protein